ncbi:MAG: hypothetical protein NT118_10710, partial [Lentisphaerae bacterium]|nr:hypothetical protein [Lentisphaerota bacterium]
KVSLFATVLVAILILTGCSSTSGSKVGTGAGTVGGDTSIAVEAPISAPVAVEQKTCENPVAVRNEKLSDTEPRSPDLTEEYGGGDPLEGFNR